MIPLDSTHENRKKRKTTTLELPELTRNIATMSTKERIANDYSVFTQNGAVPNPVMRDTNLIPLTLASEIKPHASRDAGTIVPKHSSWLNQIERVFGEMSRRVMRNGNFHGLDDLKNKLQQFIAYFNRTFAKPISWKHRGNSS